MELLEILGLIINLMAVFLVTVLTWCSVIFILYLAAKEIINLFNKNEKKS